MLRGAFDLNHVRVCGRTEDCFCKQVRPALTGAINPTLISAHSRPLV